MKKITLIQNDDGSIEVDGNPAESLEDALEQVKALADPSADQEMPEAELDSEDGMPEGELSSPSESEIPGEEMQSESIGKTLGSKMPMVDKKRMGMRPKQKASFEDYGI